MKIKQEGKDSLRWFDGRMVGWFDCCIVRWVDGWWARQPGESLMKAFINILIITTI
jgi:hypothetical protein